MSSKSLTRSVITVLGCAGAAVAAPLVAPYLATVSLPFLGVVLADVISNGQLKEKLVEAIGNTAAGFLTEIGGHFATERLPATLSREHNFHLERLLATAYLNSLKAIEEELQAGTDATLKEQAANILPSITARIKRDLRKQEPSTLFRLRFAADNSAGAIFTDRFSAEHVTLLIADETRRREQLGEEVETTLCRWLDEARDAEERATGLTQIFRARNTRLPEPLRTHLRAAMPQRIAHEIGELVKQDDFKASWIAFQRAHLQGIVRVVESIETSQSDIKASLDALAERLAGLAGEDQVVAAIAGKLEEFLSRSHLPQAQLSELLEQQRQELSDELRDIEARLNRKIEESTERLSTEGKENTIAVAEKIEDLGGKLDESTNRVIGTLDKTNDKLTEILHGAAVAARNRLKQLPAPPRDFVGRAAELAELRRALLQGGATISGVQGLGGVGKTALALKLAHEFKDRYPAAQIYLDLKGVSPQPLTPAEVMWHVVSSFHPDMKRPDDETLPAWYNSLLTDRRVLLFYDNARDAAQLAPLLPPEDCLLLVTSRKHFTLPGMFDKNLDELTEADANQLLLKIAPHIAEHADRIAEQCGRLPIALCAAASVLKVKRTLSPAEYLTRLRDRKQRLTLRDDTRDLTVEACFGLSYDSLTPEQQTRWRTLAIFPADFDAPAAAAIWQADSDAAKDTLADLEAYSLLDWEAATARFTLHDLARDFADTRLSDAEREQSGLLHATHYLQILSTANNLYQKGGVAITEGLSLFDNERVNIEAGYEWAAARFADDMQVAILCNDYPHAGAHILSLRQHPRVRIRWREAALSAAHQLKERGSEGAHLGNLGRAHEELGEYRRAIEFYEQHLAIAREIGDRPGECITSSNLGLTYTYLGETERAIELFEQSLEMARQIGNRHSEANALGNLGLAYADMGETERAIELYEQNLEIVREIGYRYAEGIILGNMGLVYAQIGQPHRAIELQEEALNIAREIGDRRNEGSALGYMGVAYADLGEISRAIELQEQRLAIAREIDDRYNEGNALGNLGIAYARLDEPDRAIECMEAALEIFEEIESPNAEVVRENLKILRGESE